GAVHPRGEARRTPVPVTRGFLGHLLRWRRGRGAPARRQGRVEATSDRGRFGGLRRGRRPTLRCPDRHPVVRRAPRGIGLARASTARHARGDVLIVRVPARLRDLHGGPVPRHALPPSRPPPLGRTTGRPVSSWLLP